QPDVDKPTRREQERHRVAVEDEPGLLHMSMRSAITLASEPTAEPQPPTFTAHAMRCQWSLWPARRMAPGTLPMICEMAMPATYRRRGLSNRASATSERTQSCWATSLRSRTMRISATGSICQAKRWNGSPERSHKRPRLGCDRSSPDIACKGRVNGFSERALRERVMKADVMSAPRTAGLGLDVVGPDLRVEQ